MNVGTEGVIYIWLSIIWISGWPFIVVPLFLFFKRSKIIKKALFLILGILACYIIQIIFEFASIPFLKGELKNYFLENNYHYLTWIIRIITVCRLMIALVVLSIMSKLQIFDIVDKKG